MKNRIEILSPGKNCRKSKRIIFRIREYLKQQKIEADIIIINDLKEMQKYKTWILPTVIINGKIVARGYKPADDKILKNLNK